MGSPEQGMNTTIFPVLFLPLPLQLIFEEMLPLIPRFHLAIMSDSCSQLQIKMSWLSELGPAILVSLVFENPILNLFPSCIGL